MASTVSIKGGDWCIGPLITVFAGVGPNGWERSLQVGVEGRLVIPEQKEVRGDAVLVAERRMGHPVAADGAKLDFAERDLAVGAPESLELLWGKKQLRVPRNVPAQGMHEEGGDGVFLQPIPEPAEGVAGGFEGGAAGPAGTG